LYVFAAPPPAKVDPIEDDMATSTLPAGVLHYRDVGTGRPLVFLHGLLQNGRLWDSMADRLSGTFRCVIPDLPLGAHRTAMRPEADLGIEGIARIVADFLDALDLHDVTLIGNDTGGAIAQIVAARHSTRLTGLVLSSCEAFDNFPPPVFRALAPAARFGLLSTLLTPMRVRALRALPSGYGWLTLNRVPHHLTDGWIAAYFTDSKVRRDTRAFVVSLGNKRLMLDIADELASFHKPTLIAWAADDKLFPATHAERLARLLPDARVEMVPNSRTWIMIDQPERTAGLITDFVDRLRP
jgi:pimeloyl-ACP methyl ester carboxylesterase